MCVPVCVCVCVCPCRAAKAEQPDRVLEVDPLAHGRNQEVSDLGVCLDVC
jgi:hypothetical protein